MDGRGTFVGTVRSSYIWVIFLSFDSPTGMWGGILDKIPVGGFIAPWQSWD